jgi:hypothetical protein
MGHFNFARGRKTSVLLVLASAGLGFAGCGGTSPDASSGTAGASTGTQAGTAGVTSVAGATATAGGSSAQAGSGTGGSGTSGSATTAGASGSASGGAGAGAGGTSSTAGTGGGGGSGGSVDPSKLDKFSFFVTSMSAMQKLAKSDKGFGGDLRYGTADGLTGADKICSEIAETVMPGATAKMWHAFLSTTKVNAKDRIGPGPWYDVRARLVAQNLAGLLGNRPAADALIKEDLPNERGFGNHTPNGTTEDDNHHTLTGSKADGTLYSMTATCKDWTSVSTNNTTTGDGVGRPRIGFSWSTGNRTNWISGQDEGGCAAGVTGVGTENGGSDPGNPIVGSGGGYGGIYCFAMVP